MPESIIFKHPGCFSSEQLEHNGKNRPHNVASMNTLKYELSVSYYSARLLIPISRLATTSTSTFLLAHTYQQNVRVGDLMLKQALRARAVLTDRETDEICA